MKLPTFSKSERVKKFHCSFETDTRFIDLFYEKKEVSDETLVCFIFIFDQFHVKLDETGWFGFSFFGSKNETGCGFII